MGWLNGGERKKIYFGVMWPYFKELGYKRFLSPPPPTFVLNEGEYVKNFNLEFFGRRNCMTFGLPSFSIKEIEDIVLEVKFPSSNFEFYEDSKRNPLKTLHFVPEYQIGEGTEVGKERVFDSEEEVEQFAYERIEFDKKYAEPFYEKYKDLPTILEEMDKLEQDYVYTEPEEYDEDDEPEYLLRLGNWDQLLFFDVGMFFRGLLISKLCNDPDYERKFNLLDKNYTDYPNEEFKLFWERAKKRLETVEGKYDYYK